MTKKRDLKKRVRERQARTGESYTTAREQVLAAQPEPGDGLLLELTDLTAEAERIGLGCRAAAWPDVVKRVEGVAALARLHEVLLATPDQPDTEVFRAVLLRRERRTRPLQMDAEVLTAVPQVLPATDPETRRFAVRVQAGLGGVSESGSALALHVPGRRGQQMVIFHLGLLTRETLAALGALAEKVLSQPPMLLMGTAEDFLRPIRLALE